MHPKLGYVEAYLICFKETLHASQDVDCPKMFAKKFKDFHAPDEPCPHQ